MADAPKIYFTIKRQLPVISDHSRPGRAGSQNYWPRSPLWGNDGGPRKRVDRCLSFSILHATANELSQMSFSQIIPYVLCSATLAAPWHLSASCLLRLIPLSGLLNDYGSDGSETGEPSMKWRLFQRTTPQPRERQRQSTITLMVGSARKQQSTSDKGFSEEPRFNFLHAQITCDPGKTRAVLSPRTTRRSMLMTELTDSLRLGLVLERQQGALTPDAVLDHRYDSHDSVTREQFPDKSRMKASEDANASLYNNSTLLHGWLLAPPDFVNPLSLMPLLMALPSSFRRSTFFRRRRLRKADSNSNRLAEREVKFHLNLFALSVLDCSSGLYSMASIGYSDSKNEPSRRTILLVIVAKGRGCIFCVGDTAISSCGYSSRQFVPLNWLSDKEAYREHEDDHGTHIPLHSRRGPRWLSESCKKMGDMETGTKGGGAYLLYFLHEYETGCLGRDESGSESFRESPRRSFGHLIAHIVGWDHAPSPTSGLWSMVYASLTRFSFCINAPIASANAAKLRVANFSCRLVRSLPCAGVQGGNARQDLSVNFSSLVVDPIYDNCRGWRSLQRRGPRDKGRAAHVGINFRKMTATFPQLQRSDSREPSGTPLRTAGLYDYLSGFHVVFPSSATNYVFHSFLDSTLDF
ncbi:hypothetical protein HRG_014328 [Hirsutella rhossiliensis]